MQKLLNLYEIYPASQNSFIKEKQVLGKFSDMFLANEIVGDKKKVSIQPMPHIPKLGNK